MYALGWLLSGAVTSMGDDLYRERLIDAFDMTPDQDFNGCRLPLTTVAPAGASVAREMRARRRNR